MLNMSSGSYVRSCMFMAALSDVWSYGLNVRVNVLPTLSTMISGCPVAAALGGGDVLEPAHPASTVKPRATTPTMVRSFLFVRITCSSLTGSGVHATVLPNCQG